MHSPFAQNASLSYLVLPHPPEHVHPEEDFPFDDYESFRSSTIPNPQYFSPGAPHIPTASWESRAGSVPRVGETALKEEHDKLDFRRSVTTPEWLPYTLRWPCLTWILVLTAILEILVIIVHAISAHELGLVTDDGSGSVIIVSKFIPTLLAVIHGIFLSILLNDVKRTQAFANLASPSGALGNLSLTWTVETWWESLYVSFPWRRKKKASWAMLCATVTFMFSFLIVSPFSSTLLVSQDVLFTQDVPFSQLDLAPTLPLRGDAIATTYFRTVSNLLQNVTTSAWIADKYAVVPFWPSAVGRVPLGSVLSDSVGTWSAKTTVFDVVMNCEQMDSIHVRPVNWTDPDSKSNYTTPAHSIKLLSPSGCGLNLTLTDGSEIGYGSGGTVWSTVRNISSGDFSVDTTPPFSISGCSQDEVVFLSKGPYQTTAKNATVTGQACNTSYYMGEPTVTVTLSKSGSLVEVDELEYSSIRKPIPPTMVDLPSFQRLFFNRTDWDVHLTRPLKSTRGFALGPAVIFSALYDFSPGKTIADSSYVQNLGRVKRRFFSELLRDAFDTAANDLAIETSGTVADTRRRVVVVPAVAITLEVSLFLQIILLSAVLVTTRLSKRPLGLFADPAPPIRVAELISGETSTLQSLDGLHGVTSKGLDLSISHQRYQLIDGQISLMAADRPDSPTGKYNFKKQKFHPPDLLDPKQSDKQSFAFST